MNSTMFYIILTCVLISGISCSHIHCGLFRPPCGGEGQCCTSRGHCHATSQEGEACNTFDYCDCAEGLECNMDNYCVKTSTETTEGPVETTEGPAETTEGPAETTEGPAETTEGPAETTEGPAETTEGPDGATEGPTE